MARGRVRLGKKAPRMGAPTWGPVTTYDADGNVVRVEPAPGEPSVFKPRKRRRRR